MGTNDVNGPLLGGEFVMKKLFQLLKVDNVQPKVEVEMTRKLLMIILILDLDFRMPMLKIKIDNPKVEEDVARKLAPFKPVPPARPPHLARTL